MCICGDGPRLELATRVVVVVHAAEWGRSSNTGHLVRLGLANATLLIHGRRGGRLGPASFSSAGSTPLILYPGRGANRLTPELAASLNRPVTLIVPDGNWNQTQHMMRRLPSLTGAETVSLDEPSLDLRRARHNADAARRSTFEAIARAIGVLESVHYEERLIELYRLMLERKDGRRPRPTREII